jgi:tRNA A-37 threonylcarbamoyl transferase component Bud32
MRSVLGALEAVHRRGVVHRDLKPANIFFGPTGEVKIGDFGVAHLVDLGTTMTGAMVGTLAYMTPEQITGASRPDASTDLYALGVILYRCLVGVLPFPGPDFVAQHLEATPEPASIRAPWLGPGFDALLARMLAKAPSDRPRTATEVLEGIDRLPWDAAEERAGVGAPTVRQRSEPPPAATAIPGEPVLDRYRAITTRDDGAIVAEDELLRRRVLIMPCDPARAEVLRRCARADSPFLQAVWGIDVAAGRAILELPEGSPPSEPIGERARGELGEAIDALHRAGIGHGEVDRDHVVLGPGRAVLLLPARAASTREADIRALAALAARRA